jgi:predicted outer membrane repeat protein
VVVRDCRFIANDAGSGAGAWVEGASQPRFARCVFEGNTAAGMGGALATDAGADLTVVDCDFMYNAGASGGAVCVAVGAATIEDCTIEENDAEFGGGICLLSSSGVWVRRTTVDSNEAGYQGGGLYASDSIVDVEDCSISDNSATLQGGAVWMLTSSGAFSRARVLRNGSGGTGDGFYLDTSGLVVNSSEIASDGTGIYVVAYGSGPRPRAPVDARWNWWGDSSGPYHPTLNPAGTGDEVTSGVNFTPWNVTSSVEEPPGEHSPDFVARTWGSIKASYR